MRTDKREILRTLKESYPDVKPGLNFRNPYEILVATILSAQCTDARVNLVTPDVFRDFPGVADMARSTPEKLFPYVKSCGFRSKAANIVNACKMLVAEYGGEVPRTMEELTRLPGVGRKTANVVLSQAFGMPAIAVDTHVFRVSNRLGLTNAKDVENTEKQLMRAIPKRDWSAAHLWLIEHGRRVCHAQKPACAGCALRALCKHGMNINT